MITLCEKGKTAKITNGNNSKKPEWGNWTVTFLQSDELKYQCVNFYVWILLFRRTFTQNEFP